MAFVLFALFVATGLASGQGRVTAASEAENVELYQALLDLQNPWTVMCVAAHPDDEDGATLTILRRKYGVHTVTVFSTYGEGGQNVVGPELYEELGAIRARETEEAARVQGSEPYFLGLRDFGFSKSADEAFRFWGHDEALRRMVLKIRELRPDVIITNHDTVTGHGHHQATGRLVLEAFDAAADPQRFPEQLRNGVTTWQVKRLFVRFQFEGSGSKQAEEEATRTGKIVSINPNERDAVRGTTYAEQALQALQHHATQGPWPKTLPPGGRPPIRYRLAREAKDAAPLPANAQTVLEGLRLPQGVEETLLPQEAKALLPLFSDKSRQNVLSALINARKNGLFAAHAVTNDQPRFRLMQERLSHALAAASGINTMLITSNKVLIPGTTTKASLNINNFGSRPARIESISLRGFEQPGKANLPKTLAPGETVIIELQSSTPRTANITVPAAEHLYDGKLFGEELAASVNVSLDGATFPVEAKTQIDVAPAVEITSITPSPFVVTSGTVNKPTTFSVHVINHQQERFNGKIVAGNPVNHNGVFGSAFTLEPNQALELPVTFEPQFHGSAERGGFKAVENPIRFIVMRADLKSGVSQRNVPAIYSHALVAPNLHVGYLPSFDETLKHSLSALGVDAKELTVDDVRAGDLSSYQTIIIDNRGYQAHPELIAANSRLMDYVKAGGNLIVFYHKNNEWNPDPQRNRPQLAPYPITLGGLRVTDENAPIEFTEPQNPLLNYPNKITAEDFKGWIQERGLYYPQDWDAHYSAPLSMNDPGEQPLRGGLLVADYGSGHYIYTSLVWYRQLRAGIPGAYRVLANMISYGRKEN
ncbi:MAG TPA: PIG-L family deacetylase [Pyrinomonadaceae bacterium]